MRLTNFVAIVLIRKFQNILLQRIVLTAIALTPFLVLCAKTLHLLVVLFRMKMAKCALNVHTILFPLNLLANVI